jgi:hypothetical protein
MGLFPVSQPNPIEPMQANGEFYPAILLIEVWWVGKDQPVMMRAAGFVPNGYGDAWVRQCKTQEEFDKWRSHSLALIKRFNGRALDVTQWRPRQPEPIPTPVVDMESIANKIKKLLALSQSPNEAEAIAASQKAQELLTRHNLSMADLADSSQEDVERYELETFSKFVGWKSHLAAGVAKYNVCKCILSEIEGKSIVFIGRSSNCKVAALQYEYLASTIDRLAKEQEGDRSYKNAFRLGAADRISKRLEYLRIEQEEDGLESDDGNISAIVITSLHKRLEGEIDAFYKSYLKSNKITSRAVRGSSYSSRGGYAAGDRAGQSVSLNKQVGAGNQKQLGGR